jgi:hypothetical protein
MSGAIPKQFVAAFSLSLEGGVTLERFRAPRGGIHKMRLIHHDSKVSVEQEYDDKEIVDSVYNDLVVRLRGKLLEIGLVWVSNR